MEKFSSSNSEIFILNFLNQLYAKKTRWKHMNTERLKISWRKKVHYVFSKKSPKAKDYTWGWSLRPAERTRIGPETDLGLQVGPSDQGHSDEVPGGDLSRFLPWLLPKATSWGWGTKDDTLSRNGNDDQQTSSKVNLAIGNHSDSLI